MQLKKQHIFCALAIGLAGCTQLGGTKPSSTANTYTLEKEVSQERSIMRSYILGKFAIHGADRANRSGASSALVSQYMDVAVPNLLHVAEQTHDKTLAEQATRAAVFSQDFKLAADAARVWSSLSGDDQENLGNSHYFAAVAAVKTQDKSVAVDAMTRMVDATESKQQGLLDVVSILSQASDKAFAIEVMRDISARFKDVDGSDYALASLLARYEETASEAQTMLDAIIESDPQDHRALLKKALLVQQYGDPLVALSLLKAAVNDFPDNEEIRQSYARLLISERRYTDARDQYEKLYEADAENTDLAFRLGVLTLELKQLDLAEKYFNVVLDKGAKKGEVMYYLGRVEELKGNYEKALENYMRVTQGEYRLDALLREAKVLSVMGKTDDALSSIEALQSLNGDEALDIRLTLSRVDILVDANAFDEANVILDRAIDRHSEAFDLLYARSMVRERLNDVPGAIDDLRTLLTQQPDNPDVMNALGYTLANRTDQFDEAYTLISQAIQLKPDSAAIMDSMGWVLFKMGNIDEAHTYLQKAYDTHPDPEIAAHLGEVLYLIGQQKEAQEVWQRALKDDPDHEVLNNVMKQYP